MPKQVELIALRYSPWSERALWALDHHRIAYRLVPHEPVIGERKLRRIVGPREGRHTVPVLLTGDETLTESWDIARYADRVGGSTPLIPDARTSEVREYNDRVDRAMEAGRALLARRLLASPAARDETLPKQIPRGVRVLLRPMTWLGTRWFAQKYAVGAHAPEKAVLEIRSLLDAVRLALGGRDYLLGAFSYADIVVAGALQGVVPVAHEFIRLGPASREAWTNATLAADYADLVAWRDRLYANHRRR
jgi:glutathione S-transferase